jgi:hypothetical protein
MKRTTMGESEMEYTFRKAMEEAKRHGFKIIRYAYFDTDRCGLRGACAVGALLLMKNNAYEFKSEDLNKLVRQIGGRCDEMLFVVDMTVLEIRSFMAAFDCPGLARDDTVVGRVASKLSLEFVGDGSDDPERG